VYTYAGSWGLPAVTRFVWDGWLMLLELDGDNTVLRKYTWGPDLAGQSRDREGADMLEGAGGVGGLLSCVDTQGTATAGDDKTYVYAYDAGGNVAEMIDTSDGSVAAHYEYDAFGNLIFSSGPYAAANR
jgi:uncharacterized protein RhaS with RHS repeats